MRLQAAGGSVPPAAFFVGLSVLNFRLRAGTKIGLYTPNAMIRRDTRSNRTTTRSGSDRFGSGRPGRWNRACASTTVVVAMLCATPAATAFAQSQGDETQGAVLTRLAAAPNVPAACTVPPAISPQQVGTSLSLTAVQITRSTRPSVKTSLLATRTRVGGLYGP